MRVATKLLRSLIAACALAATAVPAGAQSWPTRTVRLILPLGPGSGVDIGARLIADKLSTKWGQPVVVENRPGGDGIVAITAFTGAKDDHVLLMAPTSSFTAHPYLHDKLPYDPRDLAPIARISNTIVAVVVPASSDIKSVKDLVEAARTNPGKLNWATITARLLSTGQVVNPGGPSEFGAAIDAQRAQVASTGTLLDIKPASN